MSKRELAAAQVHLESALSVIRSAVDLLGDKGSIPVYYKQSLDRGTEAVRTFARELQVSVDFLRSGTPFADEEEAELMRELESVAKQGAVKKKASKPRSKGKKSDQEQ
ncbi:hypothetical protein [Roseiconus lacunae]|uniref:hypothetical protein n=1 Tax=Roseiconus lacunae TaxID=2605694 RepID=UPI001E4CFCA7|nr:hypothetical protein [Roseiconus lacunae]MCD0459142.1 hypothetical protein [Roseiconus lacunae]